MSKLSKAKKEELLRILNRPNISIESCDYAQYAGIPHKYYKVVEDGGIPSLMDIVIMPIFRSLSLYEIILPNNEKFSRVVRTNAVFHTPVVANILEVYNMLQIRLITQKTMRR